MFTRGRWLVVLVPIVFLAFVEALSDSALDALLPFPRDTILVTALVTLVGIFAARWSFRTIDALTVDLRNRNRELEQTSETLRGLHQLSVVVSETVEMDDVLREIVEAGRQLLAADAVLLVLDRPEGPLLAATSGPPEAFLPAGDGGDDDVGRFLARPFRAAPLVAPVQRGDRRLGRLAAVRRTPTAFEPGSAETLSSLANTAGIALENARLQEGLRALAIAAERERIAREMHDGLAQVLGYVNTKSQAVEELLGRGRVDEAQAQLDELAQAARSVYVDVREAILGLSSPISPEAGLAGALEDYVARFADASKLAARVTASPAARAVELGPAAEAQVFRIVQEALTNVRKHAAANRVGVDLEARDAALVVTVADDGRGFDPEKAGLGGWPAFGLRGMRDRAASIGARIEWESVPGTGSTLRLWVPTGPAGASPAPPVGASATPVGGPGTPDGESDRPVAEPATSSDPRGGSVLA